MVFKPANTDELKKAVNIYTDDKELGIKTFGEINTWDVINIEDMSNLFFVKKDFNEDISSWDTSNVNNMDSMFSGAESFNQPLNSWNTSKVKYMEHMFAKGIYFCQDLSLWDSSNLINVPQPIPVKFLL